MLQVWQREHMHEIALAKASNLPLVKLENAPTGEGAGVAGDEELWNVVKTKKQFHKLSNTKLLGVLTIQRSPAHKQRIDLAQPQHDLITAAFHKLACYQCSETYWEFVSPQYVAVLRHE